MKTKELRDKSIKDLQRQADKLRTTLAERVSNRYIKDDKKVRDLRRLKKDLARVLTIAHAKQIEPVGEGKEN